MEDLDFTRPARSETYDPAPEFALMLMSTMINRLRLTIAVLGHTRTLPDWTGKQSRVLKALAERLRFMTAQRK